MDEVRVVFVGLEAERMVFTTAEDTTLDIGITDVTLRCTVSLDISLSQLGAHRISRHLPAHLSLIGAKYDSPGFFSNGVIGRNPTQRDSQTSFLSWCRYRKIRTR